MPTTKNPDAPNLTECIVHAYVDGDAIHILLVDITTKRTWFGGILELEDMLPLGLATEAIRRAAEIEEGISVAVTRWLDMSPEEAHREMQEWLRPSEPKGQVRSLPIRRPVEEGPPQDEPPHEEQ